MSWVAVLALCGAAYALKLVGALAASRVQDGTAAGGRLDVLVVPVIAGLIAVQTVGEGHEIVLDARLPALLVAAVLIWRKAPLLLVVVAAGATAALLRAAGL
ncbi:MAG TPA: AzlD domain-containing protein [Solirubrobacteraceae bacterium]|nr:AzlD domain-containing protein [Solirubrobacteraceae bacterium]